MTLRPEPAPTPPPRRAGFALPMLMAALALGGIVAGVIGSGSVLLARMSREALYSDTARMVVKQATMRLVTESADIDNDGFPEPPAMDTAGSAKPAGGGNVPATSAAPKGDAWGTALGYCAWDNGGTSSSAGRIDGDSPASQNSITLAVVSAGPDKSFQSSCAQARANAAQGDDIVMAYSNAQVVQGVGGTVYWGDPVTDYPTLAALPAPSLHVGEQRMILQTGQVMRWDGNAWTPANGVATVDANGNVGIGHGIATGQSMFATLNVDKGSAGEALRIGTGANDQSISFGGKAGNARVTGALYDSANNPGTSGQVLTSTATGTAWQNAATVLGGTLFAQGGNSFGALATLGTSDNFGLVFRTNAAERMRLDTSGNLGLGTSSPSAKLHIAGAPATFGSVKAQLVLENNATAYNASPVSGLAFVNIYTSGGASTTMAGITAGRYTTTSGDTSSYLAFHVKDNSNNLLERMRIDYNGGLAINSVSAGSYQLYVNGIGAATLFTNISDARFKRDVAPLRMALARVGQLRGVSYRWRRDEFPDRAFDDRPQIGFIAQELEQVLPELVNTGNDGFKTVAYTGVIPVVVEAVKELHTLIGPLLPFAQVADKLQLSKDTLTLEIKAPVKIAGDLLVAGDVTAVSLKAKKVVADEVQAGKLQAGSVQSGNLQAARVTTGELGMVLDGGAQQDLLDLPLQASYTVVVSGPDGSFVHATVLNTGGLIQITAKHLNGLDLLATGTRLRVINTSVQSKRLNASWTRVG